MDTAKLWRSFLQKNSLVLLVFAFGLAIGLFIRSNQLIANMIEERASSHFRNIVLARKWNAQYGGVFVEKTEGMESNPYLENPDIVSVDGRTFTKKNPALMTREISELAMSDSLYAFHITSLNPLNPGNRPDSFEVRALRDFEAGIKHTQTKVHREGRTYFRYMAPLVTQESCLQCHAKQGYQVGDIRGGISVFFDITELERDLRLNNILIFIFSILSVSLLIGLTYIFVKGLMRSLNTAHRELAEAEKRYRQLVEETSDTVYTIDLEGRFTYVNPSAVTITGYAVDELLGMSFTELIHPDAIERVQEFYREQRDKLIPETSLEFPILIKNGETKWVEQTVNAVIKEDQLVGLQATVRDETERKKAEDALRESRERYRDLSVELEKANVTKDKFFSIIAHDLKGPLGNFYALSKMFVDKFEKFTPDKIREMVKQLHTSASQSYKLLENLLDWSRLQLGRMEFKPEPVTVTEVVGANIDLLKTQAQEKELSLVDSTDPGHMVIADRNMLSTVLRNLISNAIKFTPRGGTVTITSAAGDDDGIITATIADTGIGMSADIVASIFDIGTQHTTLGTEKEKGTGLGLCLCREFIDKNEGQLWVESTPGNGSQFSFSLPAAS